MGLMFLIVMIIIGTILYNEGYLFPNRTGETNKISMSKSDRIKLKYNEFEDIDEYTNKQNIRQEMQQLEKELAKIQLPEDATMQDRRNLERYKKNTRFLYTHIKKDDVGEEINQIKEGNAELDIKENNSSFDKEVFKLWAVQLFKYLQLCNIENIDNIKKIISTQLYNTKKNQLDSFNKDGLELKKDISLINEAKLLDYSRDTKYENIKILIDVVLTEYIEQKDTKKILRGSKTKKMRKHYVATFKKRREDKDFGMMHETNCPNCGAALEDVFFGKCEYCDTLITTIRHSWKLDKIELV